MTQRSIVDWPSGESQKDILKRRAGGAQIINGIPALAQRRGHTPQQPLVAINRDLIVMPARALDAGQTLQPARVEAIADAELHPLRRQMRTDERRWPIKRNHCAAINHGNAIARMSAATSVFSSCRGTYAWAFCCRWN